MAALVEKVKFESQICEVVLEFGFARFMAFPRSSSTV